MMNATNTMVTQQPNPVMLTLPRGQLTCSQKEKKRTVDLGVTHLDRQSCKKETIESIKEETVKNIMLYLNGQVDHKYEEMVDQEGEQEGDFVVS